MHNFDVIFLSKGNEINYHIKDKWETKNILAPEKIYTQRKINSCIPDTRPQLHRSEIEIFKIKKYVKSLNITKYFEVGVHKTFGEETFSAISI